MIRFLFPSLFPEPEEASPDPLLVKPNWRPAQLREPGRPVIALLGLLWIAGMVTAGFVDLDLSVLVVNPGSAWGIFGTEYGELPGFLVAVMATALLLRCQQFNGGTVTRILRVVGTLLLAALYAIGSVRLGRFVNEQLQFVLGAVIGVVILGALFLVPRRSALLLRPVALAIVLLAVVNPLLVVQLFKNLWGRVRFRNLGPGFDEFTRWFVPQGFTGHRSFPSGHAAMGWMLLPLAMLFPLSAYRIRLDATGSSALNLKTRAISLLIWTLVIAWGILVSASRVVVGGHYLSDVLFSTGVAFLTSYALARSLRSREL